MAQWAARQWAAVGQAMLQWLVRPFHAAWLAGLFLARRAWWAVNGQPSPPARHASPSYARLKACRSAAKARELATALGCDDTGAQLSPLPRMAPAPRWPRLLQAIMWAPAWACINMQASSLSLQASWTGSHTSWYAGAGLPT